MSELSVSAHLCAESLAGRYIDGNLSYEQVLDMCKEYRISKHMLDVHIVAWRKALGEEALLQYDISRGVEVAT